MLAGQHVCRPGAADPQVAADPRESADPRELVSPAPRMTQQGLLGTWQAAGGDLRDVVLCFQEDDTGWLTVRYDFGGGIRCDFTYQIDADGQRAAILQDGEPLGSAQFASGGRLRLGMLPNPFLDDCVLSR